MGKHFTEDIGRTDRAFFWHINWVFDSVADCILKISLACYFSPWMGLVVAINLFLLYRVQTYTFNGKDEASRLASKHQTKKYTFLQELSNGLTVIRCFEKQQEFKEKGNNLINEGLKCQIFEDSCHFYFQVRLFALSNIMFVASGILCIYLKGSMSPLYLAMMFQYLEHLNSRLASLMHGSKEIRENLISLQKLLKLEEVKQEHVTVGEESAELPKNWPEEGRIEFKNVQLKYRPETDVVLNDLSF